MNHDSSQQMKQRLGTDLNTLKHAINKIHRVSDQGIMFYRKILLG